MDNMQPSSHYNPLNQLNQQHQQNPNIPARTPAHPAQAAPTVQPQALPLPGIQHQGVPPLPPALLFLPYPSIAQPAMPPATLHQQPQFSPGPKRTTPESGFDPRPNEEHKRGRTMLSTPAAPMQAAPSSAGSFSMPHSGHFQPGTSFPSIPVLHSHTGRGMNSSSASRTDLPDVAPQIFEPEDSSARIPILDFPGQVRQCAQGNVQSFAPPLYDALRTRDVNAWRSVLADPHFEVDKRDSHGCTVLHYAAAMGYPKLVEALAEMGIDPDVRDSTGRTALHYAVLLNRKACTAALLAMPNIDVNLEIRDQGGQTALMLAIDSAHTAIVEVLLDEPRTNLKVRNENGETPLLRALRGTGPNVAGPGSEKHRKFEFIVDALLSKEEIEVSACDDDGNNALMIAVQSKSETIVRKLLRTERIDINACNERDKTALILAAQQGNESIMRDLLVTSGIAINARDENGNTALMAAARHLKINVIRKLLATDGVDVNAKNNEGKTAFTIAVDWGLGYVAALLFARAETNIAAASGSSNAALALAAARGDVGAVRDLLARPDIDVNASAAGNLTPLMLAAANGHQAVVLKLLEAPGILVNYRGIQNASALMLAAKNGHTAIVESLLTVTGIEINAWDEERSTALMFAAKGGHHEIVESLLARFDVDVNLKDGDGDSALDFAAGKGHVTVVKLLLAAPTINVGGIVRRALWSALRARNETITQLLLAFPGIDINAPQPWSGARTALMKAAGEGDEAVVRFLLAMRDIDVNAQNENNETALMLAAQNGHASIVRALLAMPDIRLDLKNGFYKQTALELAYREGYDTVVQALRNHRLPLPSSSVQLERTLQTVFASAKGISGLSAEDAGKLDDICERLESGKCAVADIAALFASVAPLGEKAMAAFVRSLAFGFCTGHFRNADGKLDETIAIFNNAPQMSELFNATANEISAAKSNIDLHRIARSNLLGIAVKAGNVRMIRGLAHLGANVNLPSPDGKTALAIAVKRKDWAACAELVSHGALPTVPIAGGYPALYHIVQALGSDDASESVALLLRQLRIKGIPFDILVKNPDPIMRKTRPVVMLSDLLSSKVEAWGKFAHLVYGFEKEVPTAGAAPQSTANSSSSLSDTSRHVSPSRGNDKA